jgi:hypothetical protein
MCGINSWILYKKCNNNTISRRDYLTGLIEELFELVNPKEETNNLPSNPSPPRTPLQNRKRSLSSSNTPVSSKKANLDSRKKCQR